jgi:hypothetical protein
MKGEKSHFESKTTNAYGILRDVNAPDERATKSVAIDASA